MNSKQRAAEAALGYIQSGMVVGLGTGTTADFFLQALAAAIQSGQLTQIRGIPTSRQSEHRARQLSIPLANLDQSPPPDVTVDGADEIAPDLNLIKGLGGALLREKIVAQNSKRLIIIADSSKRVSRLGTKSPLPVEVAPFGHVIQVPFFQALGAKPILRLAGTVPFLTDNGNHIYDLSFPNGIADPAQLESTLLHRAGVIDTGLFLSLASVALVATDTGLDTLTR
jgi:ribose 5-phosphate isomerase A